MDLLSIFIYVAYPCPSQSRCTFVLLSEPTEVPHPTTLSLRYWQKQSGEAIKIRLEMPLQVLKVHNEEEIRRILPIAERLRVPVTFRAAGTSLSGQAITDSVLLKLSHTGKNFRNYEVHVSQLFDVHSFGMWNSSHMNIMCALHVCTYCHVGLPYSVQWLLQDLSSFRGWASKRRLQDQ